MMKMVLGMPHGTCTEKNGKCMCCCHPYTPNEEGTACVVREVCKTTEELGISLNMNLDSRKRRAHREEEEMLSWLNF